MVIYSEKNTSTFPHASSGVGIKLTEKMRNETLIRIRIVNEIIKDIAARPPHLFSGKYGIAEIFEKNGRLYMRNEYNNAEMYLHTKFGYPPPRWCNGGTLWALVKEFKDFIKTGKKCNGIHRHGGLHCKYWEYSETDMEEIRSNAKKLGYL